VTTAAVAQVRSGLRYWSDAYRSMLRFEVASLRTELGLAMIIQILMGGGMAFMYGFYLGDIPPEAKLFLVSGIPALAMVPIGLVLVPNMIMSHKFRDTYDFVWSLPVPRIAAGAATFTVYTLLGIPGTALSLVIAEWYYHVGLSVSWAIVPAFLLTSLMATSVGFALGHAVPNPRITNLITNLIIFLALLFAPIVVPIEIFPEWWAAVNRALPFWHMAVVLRAGLTQGLVTSSVAASYWALSAWAVASTALSAWAVARRG
jgi:ABC-2 type transport system permease protein